MKKVRGPEASPTFRYGKKGEKLGKEFEKQWPLRQENNWKRVVFQKPKKELKDNDQLYQMLLSQVRQRLRIDRVMAENLQPP